MTILTPEILLAAYAKGYFPMARSRDSHTVEWYDPEERGVIPIQQFHAPKSLLKLARKSPYRLSIDEDFHGVIRACADTPRGHEKDTWINDAIIDAYDALHRLGFAHSVEAWRGDELVGGLYGVSIKRAFFGESMFSTASNASKLALVHLIDWLRRNGFELLDTQYVNEHLLQFGVQAIPREGYLALLEEALR